ncbi:hypothetical protein L6E12_27065 [Actinokineospora sp. PR83]|uniref:hypothetical protein n=1 Tax=Actinokineospora sp. PR83 TaxID=2884908 RepID=UPI001F416051|nr:hypothetical protein [Actinokineospora sp. PR83]MCG8919442.1 hypothetical protein [Actinokineospora sp. PR83]
MEEIAIVDRVQVDIEGLGKLDGHVAIAPARPLEALYTTKGGGSLVKPVHAFTATGHPLVLDVERKVLVPASRVLTPGTVYHGIADAEEPLSGPFTPAPRGMVAVLSGGERMPVVFYDRHGRAVLIGEGPHRELYLANEESDLVRIEGPTPPAEVDHTETP